MTDYLDPKYAFDTDRIISVLGIPDRVLVLAGLGAPHNFALALDYSRKDLLIDVRGTSQGRPGDSQFPEELCPGDDPFDNVYIYLYSLESEAGVMTWYNDHPWYDWAKTLDTTTEELMGRLQSSNGCIPRP